MRLYLAHQSDFYAFTKAPPLQDAWQDLDALLSSSAAPWPLRPEAADWTYPTAADQGGYAISTASPERLLYLTRLREACELAVSKGYGIFMALWEEPAPTAS
jgi:hypothetical protein